MGVLVDVACDALLIPRAKLARAKSALVALARERPEAFEDAEAVAAAKDLEEALASAYFRYDKGANGDITSLRYGVDKAPSDDDSWPEAVLRALAPSVDKGAITVGYEGEAHETRYVFTAGKLRVARRKKAAKKRPTAKASKASAAVVYAGEPSTFDVLPAESLGVAWSVHVQVEKRGWYRARDLVGAILDRLLATTYLAELETLAALDRPPALVAAPRSPRSPRPTRPALDAAAVKEHVANGQKERWSFTRPDGEVSVDLGIYELELELTFRARDGGLARLGDAADAEPRAMIGHLAALFGDDAWLHGFAAPFAATPLDEGAAARLDLPARWHPAAYAVILDGRIPDHEELHDEVRALLRAKAPKGCEVGCEVTQQGEVRTLYWPWRGREGTLRAALRAYDAWLAGRVARFVARTPKGAPPKPPVPRKRPAHPPGDIANYELWWRIEFRVFDRSGWYREPARIARLVEAIARTAWWPEVRPRVDLAAGVAEAIARASTGARGETPLAGPDATIRIERIGVAGMNLRFEAKAPALARMGARATTDVVALVRELAHDFRGRAEVTYACARPRGGPWNLRYSEDDEPADDYEWPEGACTTLVLNPAAHGSEDNGKLARVRALAAAPAPEGARREARDGLVVLTFLDEASDPIAAADASQAHARWQRWVRGDLPRPRKPAR